MKKRIIYALMLALSLSLTLGGCGKDSGSSKKKDKKTESSKDDDDDEDEDEDEDKSEKKKKKKDKDKEKDNKDIVADPAEDETPAAEEAPAEETSAIDDLLNSEALKVVIDQVNKELEQSGIVCDIRSNGDDILVFEYTYLEQQDFGNASKKDLEKAFDAGLTPVLKEVGNGMVEELEAYGVEISGLEIIVCNADHTVLYDKTFEV